MTRLMRFNGGVMRVNEGYNEVYGGLLRVIEGYEGYMSQFPKNRQELLWASSVRTCRTVA